MVPPWIPPQKSESLPHYAARMAETVTPDRDKPLVLGGVSFGGMLAYEMARRVKPDAVVLIASCRTRQGLRPIYRAGRLLLPLVPVQAWSVAKLLSGPVVRIRLGVPSERKELAIRMFKEMDSRFMHWALQAILGWTPSPLEGIRVLQIHGRRDSLIPARRVEADKVIPGGGHMINVSHADQVNDFIKRVAVMPRQVPMFWEDARAYCELIESLSKGKPSHFYERLLTCMSWLAKSIDELPREYSSTEEKYERCRMSHEEWTELAHQISSVVNPEIYRLVEADKDNPETVARVCMFWDDLADIYRDLREGICLYGLGTEDGIREAVWQWKSSYEIHWGLHLFDALHTVHRIRNQLHEE